MPKARTPEEFEEFISSHDATQECLDFIDGLLALTWDGKSGSVYEKDLGRWQKTSFVYLYERAGWVVSHHMYQDGYYYLFQIA